MNLTNPELVRIWEAALRSFDEDGLRALRRLITVELTRQESLKG